MEWRNLLLLYSFPDVKQEVQEISKDPVMNPSTIRRQWKPSFAAADALRRDVDWLSIDVVTEMPALKTLYNLTDLNGGHDKLLEVFLGGRNTVFISKYRPNHELIRKLSLHPKKPGLQMPYSAPNFVPLQTPLTHLLRACMTCSKSWFNM